MMNRMMRGGAVALAAGLLVGGTVATSAQDVASPLDGTSWAVTEIAGTPGSGATLVFADDRAGGSAGCNTWMAGYEAGDGTLDFGPIATTMMLCDEAVMTFEQSYLAALDAVAHWAADATQLTLTDAAGATVLAFAPQAPATLEGEWAITGYFDGASAVVGVVDGSEATVSFGPDGIVSGTGGCNRFSGGFSTDGATIAVGPLMQTLMLCEDEAINAQEAAIVAALDTATDWSVSGDTAELRGPNDTLHLTLQRIAMTPFGG